MTKLWTEDIDFDLLALIPDLEQQIGVAASTRLWTYGTTYEGRLNLPTQWGMMTSEGHMDMISYFWLQRPTHKRENNVVTFAGTNVTGDQIVETAWLDILRVAWLQHFWVYLLSPEDKPIAQLYGGYSGQMGTIAQLWAAGHRDSSEWLDVIQQVLDGVLQATKTLEMMTGHYS
jgi:hypothetical protein